MLAATEIHKCYAPDCEISTDTDPEVMDCCENCQKWFCSDHGSLAHQVGGDGYGDRCCGVMDVPGFCEDCLSKEGY
jgi:hypothetical protein